MVNDLDYAYIKFPVCNKKKITFALMYFVMIWFILFMYQTKKLRNIWIYC